MIRVNILMNIKKKCNENCISTGVINRTGFTNNENKISNNPLFKVFRYLFCCNSN